MSRPSFLFRWLTDPNYADALLSEEPNEGKKDIGFAVDEHLPAQLMNQMLGTIGRWIAYLNVGEVLHGTRTVTIGAAAAETEATGWTLNPGLPGVAPVQWEAPGAVRSLMIPINLRVGDRLTTARVNIVDAVGHAVTMKVVKTDVAGTCTQIGTTQTSTATAAAGEVVELTPAVTETIVTGTSYHIQVISTTSAAQRFRGAEVVYDRVA